LLQVCSRVAHRARHSLAGLLAGARSSLDQGKHEFERSSHGDLPISAAASAHPQQIGAQSSERVGGGHSGQPNLGCDGPTHILGCEVDIAMLARLIRIPTKAVLDLHERRIAPAVVSAFRT
jgi:hypothetical protein